MNAMVSCKLWFHEWYGFMNAMVSKCQKSSQVLKFQFHFLIQFYFLTQNTSHVFHEFYVKSHVFIVYEWLIKNLKWRIYLFYNMKVFEP